MSTISMLINGRRGQARSSAQFARRNPLDGSVATTAPAASAEDATAAIDAAAKAFPAWAAMGPVKGIVRVNGVDEAGACANDNEFGLSSAVFGTDIARAMNVARSIESGICHINGPTVHDKAQMPFGGVKGSGMGGFGGKAGIAEFTNLRWMTMQTTPRPYLF